MNKGLKRLNIRWSRDFWAARAASGTSKELVEESSAVWPDQGSGITGVGQARTRWAIIGAMRIDTHVHIFPPEVSQHRERYLGRDLAFRTLYSNPQAKMAGQHGGNGSRKLWLHDIN